MFNHWVEYKERHHRPPDTVFTEAFRQLDNNDTDELYNIGSQSERTLVVGRETKAMINKVRTVKDDVLDVRTQRDMIRKIMEEYLKIPIFKDDIDRTNAVLMLRFNNKVEVYDNKVVRMLALFYFTVRGVIQTVEGWIRSLLHLFLQYTFGTYSYAFIIIIASTLGLCQTNNRNRLANILTQIITIISTYVFRIGSTAAYEQAVEVYSYNSNWMIDDSRNRILASKEERTFSI